MRQLVALGLVALALSFSACALAQDTGATIVFTTGDMLIYEGTGEMMAPLPTREPVTVGNFRIARVVLPSEASIDFVGLVMPYRAVIDERMADLDSNWGSQRGLGILCEAIDATQPVGFRMRATAHRRGDNACWLDLLLSPRHTQIGRAPAVSQGKRYLGETHAWYVLTDMPTVWGRDDCGSEFSIVLDVGGHGSFWIKKIEIKAWPTVLGGG